MKFIKQLFISGYLICCLGLQAQTELFVTHESSSDSFTLTESSLTIPIRIDTHEEGGVLRAFQNLLTDINLVTGNTPVYSHELNNEISQIILIGTAGKSKYIDQLIAENKIDKQELKDKNEKYIFCTVSQPLLSVEEALVIAGSDKRGTIVKQIN